MGGIASKSKRAEKKNKIDLGDFKLMRSIGRGAFGKVKLVEYKGEMMALKYMKKSDVISNKNIKIVIKERDMLEKISHPFIVNMRYSFQDDYYLFMALDFMGGGDLKYRLKKNKFNEKCVKFYILELISGLLYLHSRGIIHRDVKPANILLDTSGHVHLSDFNISAYYHPKISSASGTKAYMAPEVLDGYYDYRADWWSLGVVMHEMLFGKRPSKRYKLDIPENNFSNECIDLLKKLLRVNPEDRLNDRSIKAHPYLKNTDWDLVESKKIKPPCKIRGDINFSSVYDLEESINPDPLKYKPRKARVSELSYEMKELEYKFKDFNVKL